MALVGGHRHPRPPKAAIVHAHFERKSRFQRRAAVSAEGLPFAEGKERVCALFAIIILIRKVFEEVCEKGLTEAARSGIIIAFPVK